MKRRYILYRRKRGGMFYIEDTETRKQESTGTRNRAEATSLLNARNESIRQPHLNLQIAKAYLAGTDSGVATRTWQQALDAIIETKSGATQDRWRQAAKQAALDLIRHRVILETQGEHLLACLKAGTVSTNVHLRKLHNFCLSMNWLPWPIIPKRLWPEVRFKERRAITSEEHQLIIGREKNPERRRFYELCWHLGGSQTDIANLKAEDIDWPNQTIAYRMYRKAVESAAAGMLDDSFERLDKMGAIVACGIGEQADKLADEYIRLAEQNASAVVVSQTWGEVHRVNSRVREALKGKGLLGAADSAVQALERIDLTNAQKRDERFYPPDAVIVFNQKVRDAAPGAKGKLVGILRTSVLVEVSGKFVAVSNRLLDRLTVCQARELSVANGDRMLLKANRKLASGGRVTNGELVTVKSVRTDGGVELMDGRVLDKSFREFLPGYAVTSYGSQGKTVDYVLFSDSTVKPATNAQQWYVTISRGRRGICIFTPDKQQLRENITRSGHRPLAMEFAAGFVQRGKHPLWNRLRGYLIRFGHRAAERIFRLHLAQQHQPKHQTRQKNEHKNTRMLGQRPTGTRITH
jgi:hypothetical protein